MTTKAKTTKAATKAATQTKTTTKAATQTKTTKATTQAENVESFDDYRNKLLAYAEDYKQRRLIVEKKPLAPNKKTECRKFNLANLSKKAVEMLQKNKFDYKVFENLRLGFYSKALAESVRFLNAIASGEIVTKSNCVAETLATLQDCAIEQIYRKKQLSFECEKNNHPGGGSSHACMYGELVELYGFGTYNREKKIVKMNGFLCELLSNLNIESPEIFRKKHDSTAL